jgi:hypothetical protein
MAKKESSTLDKWIAQFDDFIEGLSLGEPLSEKERNQKILDQLKWNQQRGLFGLGEDEIAKAEHALATPGRDPKRPDEFGREGNKMLPAGEGVRKQPSNRLPAGEGVRKAEGPAKEDAGTWTQGYTKAPAKSRRPGLSGTLDMGDAGAPRQDSAFTALQDENAQLKADLAEARAIASPPPGAQGAVSGTGMATEAGPAAPPPAAGATPPPPPSPHATGAFGSMVPKANTMMLGNPADAASKAIAAGNQEDAARGGGNRGLMAALSGALSGAKDAVGGVAGAVGGALSAAGGGPADPNDMPLKPEHQGKTNRELAALKRMGVDIYQRTPQFPIRGRGGL